MLLSGPPFYVYLKKIYQLINQNISLNFTTNDKIQIKYTIKILQFYVD